MIFFHIGLVAKIQLVNKWNKETFKQINKQILIDKNVPTAFQPTQKIIQIIPLGTSGFQVIASWSTCSVFSVTNQIFIYTDRNLAFSFRTWQFCHVEAQWRNNERLQRCSDYFRLIVSLRGNVTSRCVPREVLTAGKRKSLNDSKTEELYYSPKSHYSEFPSLHGG